MKICEVPDCWKLAGYNNLCAMHNSRLYRHGDINITLTNARPRGEAQYEILADGTVSIILTRGYKTVIDASDLPAVKSHSWYADSDGNGRIVAAAKINGRKVYLHKFLLKTSKGNVVDHFDRDSLNNRRKNLVDSTYSQNITNSFRSDDATGMTFNKRENKWKAYTTGGGKKKHLGTFSTEEEAQQAVDLYKRSIFGS
jgi:hypothetical protein